MRPNKKDGISIYVIGARGIPDIQGGIEKFCSKVYPLMVSQHGNNITMLTMKKYGNVDSIWNGVNIKTLSSVGNVKIEKLVYNVFSTLYCLYKRPDVVHVHSIASGTFVFLLRLFGLKVLCRYNSQDYLYPKWGKLARLILKWGELNFILSNYVIYNSGQYKRILEKKINKDKLLFVPNGIDFDLPKVEASTIEIKGITLKPGKYLLSTGRITPEKGFDILLDAFDRSGLAKEYYLIIAGDFDLKDSYTQQLCRNHKLNNVIFSGFLSTRKLRDLYRNCVLYVSSSRFEGMSNSVLEAIGYGCKVLLSDIPGNAQLLLDKKYYYESENSLRLSEKMVSLVLESARPEYAELREKYDWKKIAETINLIDSKMLNTKFMS